MNTRLFIRFVSAESNGINMAAEIKPVPSVATSSSPSGRGNQKKPILLHKIEGYDEEVNQAVLLPGEDGVIAVCDDRYFNQTYL